LLEEEVVVKEPLHCLRLVLMPPNHNFSTPHDSSPFNPTPLNPLPPPEKNHRLRLLQPHDLPPSPLPQLKEVVVKKELRNGGVPVRLKQKLLPYPQHLPPLLEK
jgi:hypothetical protein